MKFSIVCPTRNRPNNMMRLYNSIMSTASNPDEIELAFYIDNDDLASQNIIKKNYPRMKAVIGERIVLSECWNKAYEITTGSIIGFVCDEAVFKTKDWDTKVEKAINSFNDKIVVVFPYDGIHDKRNTSGYLFLHKNWIIATGRLCPPYFSCDFNDTWLHEVARMIKRHKQIDVQVEHMHFLKGKAKKDSTHIERLQRGRRDKVRTLYKNLIHERISDASKLRNFITNYMENQ